MKLKLGWTFASLAFASCLQLQRSANASPQDGGAPEVLNDRQIVIRVHDYAQVKSKVLLEAEQSAGNILREAGIEVNWVACRVGETPPGAAACGAPMTPLVFILNLLPRSMAQHLNFPGQVFGVAFQSKEEEFGFDASIFYDNVKDCAAHQHWHQHWDLAPLLGHVIAHELGHLLMGTHSHAGLGLMRDSWSSKQLYAVERRGLTFSPTETQRLQIGMARRQAALRGAENRSMSGSP